MSNIESKKEPLTFEKAQGMNRAARRRLGKENNVKIPGINKPYVSVKKK